FITSDAEVMVIVYAALERLRALGGVCATRANRFQAMLNRRAIKLYPDASVYRAAAFVVRPEVDPDSLGYAAMNRDFIVRFPDAAQSTTREPVPRTAQQLIAHEMD